MAIAAQFLLFLVLLVGGIVLVGLAQGAPVLPGLIFVAGIVSFSLAFIVPIAIGRRGM
ncbi:hypothetical protein [Microbacterium sulfonylureivorans]|uniref:hypothetical protein n=1 Tax=Microbacterium sulfonylureivorans TaxID=2486854 RepID=UPI0013E0207E|nr:hypothetical protein [Microbacterium sulfonylureivorans]